MEEKLEYAEMSPHGIQVASTQSLLFLYTKSQKQSNELLKKSYTCVEI